MFCLFMETREAEPARLRSAYTLCECLARQHCENFPVASRLLPAPMRSHVAAVYAFARTADDFADEGHRMPEERHRLLDEWTERLLTCGGAAATTGDGLNDEAGQIFLALGATIRARKLPVKLFEDLLSACRQDITTRRYATWDAVLSYCERSANPVGRLVLRIAGYDNPSLDMASDAICTALQLTNFWQDLERDWHKGRLYVPEDDWRACDADERDLSECRLTEEWRCALERVAVRTRTLFDAGRPVCDRVSGRLRLELRLTWLGGIRILDRLEASGYNVFDARPSLGARDAPFLLWNALTWRSA